jgi:predicted flavoprotein YhiN
MMSISTDAQTTKTLSAMNTTITATGGATAPIQLAAMFKKAFAGKPTRDIYAAREDVNRGAYDHISSHSGDRVFMHSGLTATLMQRGAALVGA